MPQQGQQTIRPPAEETRQQAPKAAAVTGTAARAVDQPIAAPVNDKSADKAKAKPDVKNTAKKATVAKTKKQEDEPRGHGDLEMAPVLPAQFDPTAAAMEGVVLTPAQIEAATGNKNVVMQPVRITPAPNQTGVQPQTAKPTHSAKAVAPKKSGVRGTMNDVVSSDDAERAQAAIPVAEPVDSQDAKDRHMRGKKKSKAKKSKAAVMMSAPCSPPDLRLETIPGGGADMFRLRGVLATPTEGYRYEVGPATQRSSFIAPEGGPALMGMSLMMKRPGDGEYHRADGKVTIDSDVHVAPATKRVDVVVNNVLARRAVVYYCRIPGR